MLSVTSSFRCRTGTTASYKEPVVAPKLGLAQQGSSDTFVADKRGWLYAPVRNEFAFDKLEYCCFFAGHSERAIHGHQCHIWHGKVLPIAKVEKCFFATGIEAVRSFVKSLIDSSLTDCLARNIVRPQESNRLKFLGHQGQLLDKANGGMLVWDPSNSRWKGRSSSDASSSLNYRARCTTLAHRLNVLLRCSGYSLATSANG